MNPGWTEDRVGALKKLWLEGQSASQIAKALGGGVTRNAVIGKVHRLGLSGRAAPRRRNRPAPPSAPPPVRAPLLRPLRSRPRRPRAASRPWLRAPSSPPRPRLRSRPLRRNWRAPPPC